MASSRLYCPTCRPRLLIVGEGVVKIDDRGFVVGVIERPQGVRLPIPEPLSDQQRHKLSVVHGLRELSAAEAKHLPLQIENSRRHAAFEKRVTTAIREAQALMGRRPTIREVQECLASRGQPRGRKEKIISMLRAMAHNSDEEEG